MGFNTPRLTYKYFTESDNFSAIVDKLNYNFDQTKAYGGGDKGDPGFIGLRGLPGATGIGKKGDQGVKGATVTFSSTTIVSGTAADPSLKEGDVVIDSTSGNFYNVIKNNIGNLVYNFQYSITSAIAGSIVETENQVAAQGSNPITKFYLRTGPSGIENALFTDRIIGAITDDAQMYRVVIGDSAGPTLQNNTLTLVNIIPVATDITAKGKLFSQIALKYRPGPQSYPTSNTGYLQYYELNKNETSPSGTDDTYMAMTNLSTGFGLFNDNTLGANNSYALIRGKNVRLMGTTAINQFYNNGSLNNASPYLDVTISAIVDLAAPSTMRLTAGGSGEIILNALGGDIALGSPKVFMAGALYVGIGNYNGPNTYAPANGAVIQGAIGIGYVAAPIQPSTMNAMLSVNGDIYGVGAVLVMGNGGDGNLEQIWIDDRNDIPGAGGIWHFVADAGYKADGNAAARFGRVFSERADFTGQVIIGPWGLPSGSGWNGGLANGLSVYGQSYLRDNVTMANNAVINGTLDVYSVTHLHGDFNVDTNRNVSIGGSQSYIGANVGTGYSIWRYYNDSYGNYDWFGYHNSYHDWMLTLNGNTYRNWHSGNVGPGSGLNADLLDGIDSTGFVRIGARSDGDYVWIRNPNTTLAFGVTQQSVGAPIQRWFAGAGDGSQVASMSYGGVLTAVDFATTSDQKLKTNIKPIKTAKDIINALNPVTFKWKEDGIKDKRVHSGFIAQSIEKIDELSHIVNKNEEGTLGLSINEMIPFLAKALQEAFAEIADLRKQVQKLK